MSRIELYMIAVGAAYLTIGFANLYFEFTRTEFIQVVFILILGAPLVFKKLGRWLHLKD